MPRAPARHEGFGALYVGLTPIAMRQLPYTATKLVTYDMFARAAKGVASTLERTLMPDSDGKRLQPFAIVLAGMLAGAAAAVVSHPADLLLTRLCGSSATTNLAECVIADGVPGGGKSRRRRGPRTVAPGTGRVGGARTGAVGAPSGPSRCASAEPAAPASRPAGFLEQAKYLWSLGLAGAYSGLGPRLAMTSVMTSIQFTIYEGVRSVLGVAGRPPPKPVVIPA